ncbi:MAG: hypothetical protein IJ917_10530, partial [Firmicutes bacterium]|nr:hypothetical protein [Bacillota bacterium]
MKRTQFKDAARNIRKQWVSWLSVIIIATLAVSAYLGIRFSADALRSSANGFYEDASFRDVEIISTLLFNEADLEALRGSQGVQEVVGLRSLDTSIIKGSSEQSVTIVSLSETVNRPSLTSGSFPEAPDQCLVESDIADALSLSVGDTIQVPSSDYLAQTSFTLTGIVTHPDHIATSEDVPGNRYVLVPMEAFSAEAFDNCYTSAEILFEKPQDSDRFSKDYFDLITPYQASLEALGETQVLVRRQELVDRAQETIDENQEKLDEAETELQDARAELDETHELLEEKKPQLEDAALTLQEKKAELDAAKEELDDAKKELDAAAEELEEASQELESARTQLDNAAGELSSARTQLSQGYEQMLDGREKLQNYIDSQLKTMFPVNTPKIKWAKSRSYDIDSPNLTMRWVPMTRSDSIDLTWNIKGQVKDILISYALDNGISKKEIKLYEPLIDSIMADYSTSKFEQQCEQWQVSHDAYISNRGQYYAGLSEFNTKEAEYQAGVEEYEAGLESYEAGEKDYKKAKKQYKKKKAEYEQAVEDLAAAETELEEKEAEYDD